MARDLTGLPPGWAERGITAGQLTWREAQAAWPPPIAASLNNRPRKTLEFMKPSEKLAELLAHTI